MAVDITALYCCIDDFCKVFEDWEAHRLIPSYAARHPLRRHSSRCAAGTLAGSARQRRGAWAGRGDGAPPHSSLHRRGPRGP